MTVNWQDTAPKLAAKLDPAHVSQRRQGGMSVSYVEGWHVIAEANRIFGHGAWTRETIETRCVSEKSRKIGREQKDGFGVTYVCRVRITVGDVTRDGTGAGHGIGADLGECHESAIKEAETDAMKRAFMTFGNPFGLALYDKSRANVGRDEPPQKSLGVGTEEPDYPDEMPRFDTTYHAGRQASTAWKKDGVATQRWRVLRDAPTQENMDRLTLVDLVSENADAVSGWPVEAIKVLNESIFDRWESLQIKAAAE